MKKKQLLTIGALLLVLIVLIAGINIYKAVAEQVAANKEKASEEESVANTVHLFVGETISAMEIDGLKFVYGDDGWEYEADENFVVNSTTISNIATAFYNLTAGRVLRNGDTPENYGLTNPTHVVVVTDESGTEYTYTIGAEFTSGTYYVMMDGIEDTIYTCSISYSSYLSDDLSDYEETTEAETTEEETTDENAEAETSENHAEGEFSGEENTESETSAEETK